MKTFNSDAIHPVFKAGAVVTYTIMLVPVLIVVLAGLNAGDYLTFPPRGLSLRWVKAFLTSSTFLKAYGFSFGLALCVMVIATALGTATALFISRAAPVGKSLTRAFFLSPLILPGIIIGLALYVFYATSLTPLLRTFPGMLIGHVIISMPYVVGTVLAALSAYDTTLEEAARGLGAGPFTAFRKITLPIIKPGVTAGSVFAFIVSFGQFDLSLFLSTPDLTPLPIAMYTSLRYKFEPTAAAAGIFAIILVVASIYLTDKLIGVRKLVNTK